MLNLKDKFMELKYSVNGFVSGFFSFFEHRKITLFMALVSHSNYVVIVGLHVFVCYHIRTFCLLTFCFFLLFFMSSETHLMGLL